MPRRRLHDDVPRIPRGRGLRLTTAQVVQVVMVATALVAVILLQKPCARSVSRFVNSFDPADAGVARTDAVVPEGVILRGDMTPAELAAQIAKARAAAGLDRDGGVALDAGTVLGAGTALDAGTVLDARP